MSETILQLSRKLNISKNQVEQVLNLLDNKATIPFIARYRKDQTGGLDEEIIRKIEEEHQYLITLNKRKETIITILKEKEILTTKIYQNIIECQSKSELEALYNPFKTNRQTKASQAIALGFKPLALKIFNSKNEDFNPYHEARKYLNQENKDLNFILEQSKLIIAELINQDIEGRQIALDQIFNYGFIKSKIKNNDLDLNKKFKNYAQFKSKISLLSNHQVLALNRGENLKILSLEWVFNLNKIKYNLNQHFFKIKSTGKLIYQALEDSLKRLIIPSLKLQIWKELFEKAQTGAIKLFGTNLEIMLLAPAIKNKVILAIDPGYVSGSKIAIVDPQGYVLTTDIIKPLPPINQIKQAETTMINLIKEFKVDIIVIGNGTGGREIEQFIASLINKEKIELVYSIISESGASVYSASKIAIEEFPNLTLEKRSAIHLARKFQDPLNELVKIEPKAIGVGQYQHDVNQKKLKEFLNFKVQKVVNQVGIDVNRATFSILNYAAGLNNKIAKSLIAYRKENGPFKTRQEIKNVPNLGIKTYEQAVGFLRINDSPIFYDRTAIHPEFYEAANKIVKYLNLNLENFQSQKINQDIKNISDNLKIDYYQTALIINALKEPQKDIRDLKSGPILRSDILNFNDLKRDLILDGVIQNVTDFGIFVYVGLKESVFIHLSNLSSSFINHPLDIIQNGQHIKLKIIEINQENHQIKGQLISQT